MIKIEKYDIVVSSRPSDVGLRVQEMIKNGWQPFGSGYFSNSYGSCQPMVKYEVSHAQETTYKGTPISLLNDEERAEYDHEMMEYLSKMTGRGGRL